MLIDVFFSQFPNKDVIKLRWHNQEGKNAAGMDVRKRPLSMFLELATSAC